jgi:hypothetical protein
MQERRMSIEDAAAFLGVPSGRIAGWCPGAAAHDWTIDLRDLSDLSGRDTLDVAYGVADFENTCRPDAPTCAGCTLGNDCAWNDSNHTEPNFQVSALLIAYQ